MIRLDFTFFITIVNFIVLYFAMRRLFFLPLMQLIRERREEIENHHQNGETFDEESRTVVREYSEKLRQGKREVALFLDQEKQKIWMHRKERLTVAQEKSLQQIEAFREKLDAQAREAGETLSLKSDHLADQIVEKILGRKVKSGKAKS